MLERIRRTELQHLFFQDGVLNNNLDAVKRAIELGQPIEQKDPVSGTKALNLAIGLNRLEIAEYLVGKGALWGRDALGRLPSEMAAEAGGVSDEMAEFIRAQEAARASRAANTPRLEF